MKRLFKNISRTQIEIGLYALLLVVVGFAVCMAIWNSGELWARLWSMVCTVAGPLLFGCMLSYMFNPLVTRIERALVSNKQLAKNGANMRPAAAIVTVIMVVLVLLVMLGGLAAVLSDGFVTVGWGSLQDIMGRMTTDFEGFAASVTQRVEDLGIISTDTVEGLLATFTSVSVAFTAVVFTITFTIWFLIDGGNLFVSLRRTLTRVLGARVESIPRRCFRTPTGSLRHTRVARRLMQSRSICSRQSLFCWSACPMRLWLACWRASATSSPTRAASSG